MYENPAILLLHGALGTKAQFARFEKHLSNTYQVYKMDFSGHGSAGRQIDFTIAQFVEDVKTFVDKKNIAGTKVFGYSMGGYVALKAASGYPSLFAQVNSFATKFAWTDTNTRAEVAKLNPELIQQKVPGFAERLKKEHPKADWKMVVSNTARLLESIYQEEYITEDELKRINIPVNIMIGTRDTMVSEEESQVTADLLPKGRLIILPDVVHEIHRLSDEQIVAITSHL